jgi:hypothetical protein
MKGVRFGEGTKRMAPGEVFFLYTDGLSKNMNRSEDVILTHRRLAKPVRNKTCTFD